MAVFTAIELQVFLDGEVGVERSEEHTSELQSQFHLVCRFLLEKKTRSRVTSARGRSASTRDSAAMTGALAASCGVVAAADVGVSVGVGASGPRSRVSARSELGT